MKEAFLALGRGAALATLLWAPLAARADCSRDIVVPVAQVGASVVLDSAAIDGIGGIYPELLRTLGAKAGCHFLFSAVPRARLELMFETGKADLLVPASGTPRRDRHGWFVPMIANRPLLISVQSERAPIASVAELIARRELRVALVRGYDYGGAYQELIKELERQGRLSLEVDPLSVARLLQGGFIDATIMAPTILAGTARADPRVQGLLDKLRLEPLPELPWGLSGIYVSRKSLTPADQSQLRELLEQAARSGALMAEFQRYHGQELLSSSIRPR